jgi:hypothetical protein
VVVEAVVMEAWEAVVCSLHRPFGCFVAPQQSVPSELQVKNHLIRVSHSHHVCSCESTCRSKQVAGKLSMVTGKYSFFQELEEKMAVAAARQSNWSVLIWNPTYMDVMLLLKSRDGAASKSKLVREAALVALQLSVDHLQPLYLLP